MGHTTSLSHQKMIYPWRVLCCRISQYRHTNNLAAKNCALLWVKVKVGREIRWLFFIIYLKAKNCNKLHNFWSVRQHMGIFPLCKECFNTSSGEKLYSFFYASAKATFLYFFKSISIHQQRIHGSFLIILYRVPNRDFHGSEAKPSFLALRWELISLLSLVM